MEDLLHVEQVLRDGRSVSIGNFEFIFIYLHTTRASMVLQYMGKYRLGQQFRESPRAAFSKIQQILWIDVVEVAQREHHGRNDSEYSWISDVALPLQSHSPTFNGKIRCR